jgi:ferredoxin-NADP reductase
MGPPAGVGPPSGMGDMGEMMKMMGGSPPKKEFYPSLMDVKEFSPEQRDNVSRQAHERMQSGASLLSAGLDRLNGAVPKDDYVAMDQATAQMREGLTQFESGVAAHRAVVEGKPPRDVALQWFRREMNLSQPVAVSINSGTSWFHAGVMTLLIVFAVVMIWMYFFKMRRAAVLLRSLTGETPAVSPPGGAAVAPVARSPPTPTTDAIPVSAPAPRSNRWAGKLRVAAVFDETPNVKTFRLTNPLGGILPFDYLPGQFLTVTATIDGKPVKRSYTIASSPTQRDYVELTIKHEEGGAVSGFFHEHVNEGELVDCSGPSGSFIFTGRECKCILMIAGGVGITPLMSVLRYLTDRSWPGDIFLIHSVHSPQDLIFREELAYLQRRHPTLRVIFTVSHPEGTDWSGASRRITKEFIKASVPDLPSRYVHVCGPVPMMETVRKELLELGVPAGRIKTEAFGPALGKPEPTQAPPPTSAEAPAEVALPTVSFSVSEKSAPFPPDKTILDVADQVGVDIDNSCRVGTCGTCRVKLLAGTVSMAVEEGLEPGDRDKRIILACQAKSSGDVTVEA